MWKKDRWTRWVSTIWLSSNSNKLHEWVLHQTFTVRGLWVKPQIDSPDWQHFRMITVSTSQHHHCQTGTWPDMRRSVLLNIKRLLCHTVTVAMMRRVYGNARPSVRTHRRPLVPLGHEGKVPSPEICHLQKHTQGTFPLAQGMLGNHRPARMEVRHTNTINGPLEPINSLHYDPFTWELLPTKQIVIRKFK